MKTEEVARTKWCPMARGLSTYGQSITSCNRGAVDDPISNCIASDCMMWVGKKNKRMCAGCGGEEGAPEVDWQYCRGVKNKKHNYGDNMAEGYCGLAS